MINDPLILELVREEVSLDPRLEGLPIEELVRRIPPKKYIDRIWPLIRWPKSQE